MVSALNLEASVQKGGAHLVAQVGVVVDGRNGEVATLVAGLVAQVAAFFFATGVPCAFDGVDEVVASVLLGFEANVVKDVELGFWSEVDRVSNAGALEVFLSLGCHVAWVAAVELVGERVNNREVHVQRLGCTERVNHGSVEVGNQLHV
ncbi:unannotated protein [freshwater metagenome]|uniref:Unannotated protein n=1 Tax=freshwater metagenome TaxID=449393 RepID=A0A6J6C4J2_9ZZZZ